MLKKFKDDRNDSAARLLNSPLFEAVGVRKKEGFLYGLELELEGHGVALDGIPSKNWKRVDDGSLRGESIEYVFSQPCDYEEAVVRVNKLFSLFDKHGVKLKDSYRTSTHVHLNFSDKTGKQIVNFFFLHTILEEILEYYCGDLRKGNLFCMSCRDNEELLNLLESSFFMYGNYGMFNDEVRYNAANLAALNKFGTIEIRTMRGANSVKEVVEWLEVLRSMYEFACSKDCPPPWKLVENLSHLGPEGFLGMVFPPQVQGNLLKSWPAVKDLRRSLMDGVRLVQLLAYKLEEPWTREGEQLIEEEGKPAVSLVIRRELGMHDVIAKAHNGQHWNVRHNYLHGEAVEDDPHLIYDAFEDVFLDGRNGGRCGWIRYLGEDVIPGSELDLRVNFWLHDDDLQEEELPDWGE